MQLDIALTQIAEIRLQMQRTRQFRGFRAASSLAMGIAAVGAGIWQGRHIPESGNPSIAFVDLWVCVALASMLVCTGEALVRFRRLGSSL
jgi:hypothetical protein